MCSLLQENLLGGKEESVSRSYVHVCWKKVMKMKRFNEEVYTGSPKVNLSCFREFEELERCLRYSGLKKFMVCACLILAGRLFQTSGALLGEWQHLIHFFDFFGEKKERCSRKFDRLLCCFDPLSITPLDSAKNANRFEKCNVFGNRKCELSAIQERRNWGANFWQGKAQNSSQLLRCTFLARRSAKLIANFSATMVTSLRSFSLSLSVSLSLSPNVSHAQYRKRFRASYKYRKRFRASYKSLFLFPIVFGINSLKWRLTDRYPRWGTLADPRPGRGHSDQCKSREFLLEQRI